MRVHGRSSEFAIHCAMIDSSSFYSTLGHWSASQMPAPYRRYQMAHTITARLLEDYLKCHSKAYLRVHGRAGEANEYLALCSLLDACHRADASLWLSTPTT